jgi:hypothetical protein
VLENRHSSHVCFDLLIDPAVTGEILLGDVNISRITHSYLRSHLDSFDYYFNKQCWLALEDVQFKQFVNNHSASLSVSIAESDNNLSVDQCKLQQSLFHKYSLSHQIAEYNLTQFLWRHSSYHRSCVYSRKIFYQSDGTKAVIHAHMRESTRSKNM